MRFPAIPPAEWSVLTRPPSVGALLSHLSPVLPDGRYLHWDELRRRAPPEGLTAEQWWAAHKLARRSARVLVPGFLGDRGEPFWFSRLDAIDRATHTLDRRDATREMLEAMGDDSGREHYRIDQLIEEAINSSLIEGAKLTTRAQAKEIIRDGRRPTTRGERMVVNNYKAMRRLLELAGRPLQLDDLLEIHATLGVDALDTPEAEGRLRTDADNVRVEDSYTGAVWFVPPPAAPSSLNGSRTYWRSLTMKRREHFFTHSYGRSSCTSGSHISTHSSMVTAALHARFFTGRCSTPDTTSPSTCPSRVR